MKVNGRKTAWIGKVNMRNIYAAGGERDWSVSTKHVSTRSKCRRDGTKLRLKKNKTFTKKRQQYSWLIWSTKLNDDLHTRVRMLS